MRGRFTYANVTATVALFVALAGSAYAATQINGQSIRKHSIPGNRMERNAVVPEAVKVKELRVFHGRGHRRHHHSVRMTANQASTPACPSTLVCLSVGQVATLYSQPPYTVTATCSDLGNGRFKVEVDATASIGDWYTETSSGANNAGDVVQINEIEGNGPTGGNIQPFTLSSAQGAVQVPASTAAVHEIWDCSVAGMGVS